MANPFVELAQGTADNRFTLPAQNRVNPFIELAQDTADNPFITLAQARVNPFADLADEPEPEPDTAAPEPQGFFGGVLDLISRGQFASAKFTDTLAQEGITALGDALTSAAAEFVSPQERLSYSDVIRRIRPEFAEAHPKTTALLGFVGDVALDPTTYLTLGAGSGARITVAGATRVLTKRGEKALQLAMNLGKRESKHGERGLKITSTLERRESAEKMVSQMAVKDPTLLVGKGLRVGFKIPKGREIEILSPKITSTIAELTGLSKTADLLTKLRDTKLVETFRGAFIRNRDLPIEYTDAVNKLLAAKQAAEARIGKDAERLFKGLGEESRENIARVGAKIDDMTRRREAELGRTLTPKEAMAIKNDVMRTALSPKEVNTYRSAVRTFKEIRQLEQEAGLLADGISNYFPRGYALIADAGEFAQVRKSGRLSSFLQSSQHRKFQTLDDAVEAGYVPEFDAAKLYTSRVLASARALRHKEFNDLVSRMKFTKKEAKLVKNDMEFVGESRLDAFSTEEGKTLWNALDNITRIFKGSATVLKPNFAVRQAPSNLIQSYLIAGAKAFRALDPRVVYDAHYILKHLNDTPVSAQRLSKSIIDSDLGDVYTGTEVAKAMLEFRIVQGTALGGVKFADDAIKELKRIDRNAVIAKRTGINEGLVDFVSKSVRYWRWPGMVEDHARAALFMNGLRMGHSKRESAKLVNKALFDYQQGLSKFEKRWMRRIVPFYTFQRFAIPMALHAVGTAPGRIANTKKGVETFFEVWNKMQSNDTLTESERHALPGWLLEQPSTFAKFGLEGEAVFNAFNNFTPLDVLHFAEVGKGGEFNLERTVQKTVLSTLAPWIKIPLETVAFNRNFFTGRVIRDAGLERGISRQGESGKIAAAIDAVLPQPVKDMIGWEVALDPVSGKRMTYVNPYLAHTMRGQFPVVGEFVRLIDARLTPTETALAIFGGVTTYKMDLREQASYKIMSKKREVNEQRIRIRRALKEGRGGTLEKLTDDLRDLLTDLQANATALRETPIRGAGGE